MRHRVLGLAAAGLLVVGGGGCASDERPSTASVSTSTSAVPGEAVVGPVGRVLRRAEDNGETAFGATFDVLRKLGGGTASVDVVAADGIARIDVADLVVVSGPEPATCRVSARSCVGAVREEQLAPYGIFTGFWSTGPAQALRTLVARDDAGPLRRSTRTLAGVELDCVTVPVGAGLPNTSCITPEGVFGYVDTPSVRVELTDYRPGTPAGGTPRVPFPVGDDDAFLAEPTP